MKKPKLYDSKVWLRKRFLIDKKTIDDIAEECKVTSMTIRRKLEGFNLIKKR